MAVWLVRALDGTEPDPSGGSMYADVDSALWWAPYTSRLADLEVTRGCRDDPPRYCPDRPVTRAQMASFLARAFELPGGTPGRFSDTAGSPHAKNIDKLAEAGITAGCGQGRYCPDRAVTRAQMATFLARALKLVPLPGATPIADEYRLAYSMRGTSAGPTEGRYGWANQIWMAGLQGSREFIGWYGAAGGDHPIFSPDGNWVAYGIDDKGYVMNTDSRTVREVLTRDRWSYNFRWSPDSRYLVYNSTGGVGDTNWIERSDGENRRSIGLLWRFSPDGRLALYSVFNQVGGERIYSHTVVEDLETGMQVKIDVDEANVRYAEFTPDSQRISWVAQSPTSNQQDLWMMDVDGSSKVKLLTAVVGDLPGSAKIRWSPDGTRFAYVKGYGIGTQFLVADAVNGHTIMELGISKCNYLNWAPDSAHLISDNRDGLVFNTRTGDTIRQRDLYAGDPRYGRIRNLRWSPDNQAIAFILEEETPSDGSTLPYSDISTQLWIADADGQNKRKLVDENAGYDFRWSPDGTRIAYSILTPFGIEEHEGEQYPLHRSVSELWITSSDGGDRWRVAKPQAPGIRLLGWLPS
ncbi:MAG: S-layer homology domain-containing protein [bacterium]|nr:S-layer homology domain-containing protein [bacterium]